MTPGLGDDLGHIRGKIDVLDRELVRLLGKREILVRQAGEAKR